MENDSKAAVGIDWAAGGYTTAAKSLQVLAEEIAHMSATSFEQNAKLIDDLRGARNVEDFVAIQTKFMAGMFETFSEHVRLMSARMADLRDDISDAGFKAVQTGVDSARSASETALSAVDAPPEMQQAIDQALEVAEDAAQASLHTAEQATQSTLDAAIKAADTIKNAAQAVFAPDSETFSEHSRPLSAHMADLRSAGLEAMQTGIDSVRSASETALSAVDAPPEMQEAIDHALEATKTATEAGVQMAAETTRSTFDAAIKAAETIQNAAQAVFAPESETFSEQARPLSARMADLGDDLSDTGLAAMQAGIDSARSVSETALRAVDAPPEMQEAIDHALAGTKAATEAGMQMAAEAALDQIAAAIKAAETIQNATQAAFGPETELAEEADAAPTIVAHSEEPASGAHEPREVESPIEDPSTDAPIVEPPSVESPSETRGEDSSGELSE